MKRVTTMLALVAILVGSTTSIAAAASQVEVQGGGVGDSISQVTTELNWTPAGITAADKVIAYQAKRLEKALERLRNKGATTVYVRELYGDDTWAENAFLKPAEKLRSYELRARVGKNKRAVIQPAPMSSAPGIASRLVHLKQSKCSLLDFNLFNPASWFADRCAIVKPAASTYLRYSLISWLYYSQSEDLWRYRIGQLQTILDERLSFKVEGNCLVAPGLAKAYPSDPEVSCIPIAYEQATSGYKIEASSDHKSLRFVKLAPDVKAIAAEAHLVGPDFISFEKAG